MRKGKKMSHNPNTVKLFVMSTLEMDKADLRYYAHRVSQRAEGLSENEFLNKIYKGERVCIKFPDETVTTYELIEENYVN